MKAEIIHYASIAHVTGCVSYTGELQGNRLDHYTYDQPSEFDWSRLRGDVPVIDFRGVDFYTVWNVAIRPDYATPAAKIAACRLAGIEVRCAAYYRTDFVREAVAS